MAYPIRKWKDQSEAQEEIKWKIPQQKRYFIWVNIRIQVLGNVYVEKIWLFFREIQTNN